MNELVKIHNVTLKVADSTPVKVLLNIDAVFALTLPYRSVGFNLKVLTLFLCSGVVF